ncbi:hypothetical protein CDAR_257341 [Caerostris darwini]|uniref:Uncharacterized protein n=1 Tax=Caerostris darwini TaxID=1538125 RepID=A0AAV4PL40_9ARAC|nr:hypothetical protein CDAR_257341 [Caerostris darwini]
MSTVRKGEEKTKRKAKLDIFCEVCLNARGHVVFHSFARVLRGGGGEDDVMQWKTERQTTRRLRLGWSYGNHYLKRRLSSSSIAVPCLRFIDLGGLLNCAFSEIKCEIFLRLFR